MFLMQFYRTRNFLKVQYTVAKGRAVDHVPNDVVLNGHAADVIELILLIIPLNTCFQPIISNFFLKYFFIVYLLCMC